MVVTLLVSPIWDSSGERRELHSNFAHFTDNDQDLEEILFLGGYLAHNIIYEVLRIRFEHSWQTGYISVVWYCKLGTCCFEMHVSIAKWDVTPWKRESLFSYTRGISDMSIIYTLFEEWAIYWSPELLEVCRFQTTEVIGAKKRDGTWRVIMHPKDRLVVTLFNNVEAHLNASLNIGPYNRVGRMHFSLDHWWGEYPLGLKTDLF